MEHKGEFYPVKITVKEFAGLNETNRIYSVEAVNVAEIKKAADLAAHPDEQGRDTQTAAFNESIAQLTQLVNPHGESINANPGPNGGQSNSSDTPLSATSSEMSSPRIA
ncbi:MAG: hypothetical protein LBT00_10925 [Spirochaetaceae bacterium]|jgi:hypothetical protein|nr:hypothetical protein [Spirochaetaceae bacterium]